MQIYVSKNNERYGPYTLEEVLQRLQTGQLDAADLAWHEGLATWAPLSQVVGHTSPQVTIPPLPQARTVVEYAGFWKRLAAFLIDYVALLIPTFAIGYIIGLIYAHNGGRDKQEVELLGNGVGILLFWLYFSVMESSALQGTLGKLALSIKVTDTSGQRVSFGKATGRHFGKIVSGIVLGIGLIMAGFTERKQALHDMMAGCLVVRR